MSMTIEELTNQIVYLLTTKCNMKCEITISQKSDSHYIKVNGVCMIRVSNHYSHHDCRVKFNIGDHISSFHRLKGSLYYKSENYTALVKRLLKETNHKISKKH